MIIDYSTDQLFTESLYWFCLYYITTITDRNPNMQTHTECIYRLRVSKQSELDLKEAFYFSGMRRKPFQTPRKIL